MTVNVNQVILIAVKYEAIQNACLGNAIPLHLHYREKEREIERKRERGKRTRQTVSLT